MTDSQGRQISQGHPGVSVFLPVALTTCEHWRGPNFFFSFNSLRELPNAHTVMASLVHYEGFGVHVDRHSECTDVIQKWPGTQPGKEWDVFTVRFYSRGIPFPGSHCGANRPSESSAVHSFQSCRGRRASFLGQKKNSSKSISNLIEPLATRPEGWTCSILKEPCV